MFFLIDACETSDVLKVIYFVFQLIKIAFMIIPMALIAMISFDFARNVISNVDDMKKNLNVVIKRILMCVAVFLVPMVVNVLINIVEDADIGSNIPYRDCLVNSNLEKIDEIEGYEITFKEQRDAERKEKLEQKLKDGKEPTISTGGTITSNSSNNSSGNNTSEKAEKAENASVQAFIDALDKMSSIVEKEYKNGKKWHYSNSSTAGNFNKERKSGRETNCAKYVSWGLVEIGIFKSGDHFWKGSSRKTRNKICGSAASKVQKHENLQVLSGNGKTAKSLVKANKLKTGDIVLWYNHQHTNVYAGNEMWYDAGRWSANNAGKSGNYFKTFGPVKISALWDNWGIWKIIRIKES